MSQIPRIGTLTILMLSAAHFVAAQSYSNSTIAGTTTIKDGIPASQAFLRGPIATQADSKGNIYILDQLDGRVRKIDTKGIISTVAGNGLSGLAADQGKLAIEASLYFPDDIAVDRAGLNLYIADTGNYRVLKVNLSTGQAVTIAGNGSSKVSGDGGPAVKAGVAVDSIAVDEAGNVYTADSGGARIRRIDAVTGIIRTFVGNGMAGWTGDQGPAISAEIGYPWSLTTDKQFLYIADPGYNLVRRVDLTSNIITTYVGIGYLTCPVQSSDGYCASSGDGGNLDQVGFAGPTYVNADEAGNLLIMDSEVVDGYPAGGSLRFIAAGGTTINHIAGSAAQGYSGDGTGGISNVAFQSPFGVAIAGQNTYLIADSGNYRVREIKNNAINAIAGFSSPDGEPATSTVLNYPVSAAMDQTGDLYIADAEDHRVRKAAAGTGIVSTVLGTGLANNDNGGFPNPISTATGPNGGFYAANSDHIVRIDPTGTRVIAGTAGDPGFQGEGTFASGALVSGVRGMRTDGQGNLYFADSDNFRVRRIDATTGLISTVAGNGKLSGAGENVAATSVGIWPYDVEVDSAGNLYITDVGIPRVRKVAAGSGLITTVAGGTLGNGGDGGPAIKAGFLFPIGVAVDAGGDIFIADSDDGTIRRVDGRTGHITRVAGTGDRSNVQDSGAALLTSMQPTSILAMADGSLLVTDSGNDRIRKLIPQTAKKLSISSGNNQTGATNGTLAIGVMVTDDAGLPVATVPVTFAVKAGDATVAPATVQTIGTGTATATVILGQTTGPVTVTASSAGLGTVTFTLTAVAPFINATNGVTGLPMSNPPVVALSQNGLMQISGQGFLSSGLTAGIVGDADLVGGELPTVYHGVCVNLSGTPAPLMAVSGTQIVFQVPVLQAGGTADVSVTTACGSGQDLQSAAVTLPVQTETPEFFYVQHNADGTALVGAMNNATGEQALVSQPGDSITVYLTGLGATDPAGNPGNVISSNLGVNASVTIQLGAETITPDWVTTPASLPGIPYVTGIGENAGVYMVQFTIPADAPAGNLPLVAMTGDGAASPATAYLVIQTAAGPGAGQERSIPPAK